MQFKPKEAGVTLYFSLNSCERIRNLIKSMTLVYTSVPTGKFGAPNCPVRALLYYHRYLTEHLELRKGRHHLFILIKNNNPERSCTTIVDSHGAFKKSKSIPGSVKAHKV